MIDIGKVWWCCLIEFRESPQQCTTLLFQREILAGNVSATSAIAVSSQGVTRPLNRRLLGLRLGPACRRSFELLSPKVYNFLRQPTSRDLQDNNEYGYRWKQEKEDRPRVFWGRRG
jgi:hypothetical protein